MAFCSKCGAQVADQAVSCSSCGQTTGTKPGTSSSNTKVESVSLPAFLGPACYFGGWITGMIVLTWLRSSKSANDPRLAFLRFHAAQSNVVFGGLTIIYVVLSSLSIPIVLMALLALGFALWLFLMFKSYQGQMYKLPVAGDLAESLIQRLG